VVKEKHSAVNDAKDKHHDMKNELRDAEDQRQEAADRKYAVSERVATKDQEVAELEERLRRAKLVLDGLKTDEDMAADSLAGCTMRSKSLREALDAHQDHHDTVVTEHLEHKEEHDQHLDTAEKKKKQADHYKERSAKEKKKFAPLTHKKEAAAKRQEVAAENVKTILEQAALQENATEEAMILTQYWEEELKVRGKEKEAAAAWWSTETARRQAKLSAMHLIDVESKLRKASLLADWVENPAEWRAQRHNTEKNTRKAELETLAPAVENAKREQASDEARTDEAERAARAVEEEAIRMRNAMGATRTRSMSQIEDSKETLVHKVASLYKAVKEKAFFRRGLEKEEVAKVEEEKRAAREEREMQVEAAAKRKQEEKEEAGRARDERQRQAEEDRRRRTEEESARRATTLEEEEKAKVCVCVCVCVRAREREREDLPAPPGCPLPLLNSLRIQIVQEEVCMPIRS